MTDLVPSSNVPDYRRVSLSRLLNRWVTGDAVLVNEKLRDRFGTEYHLVQNVRFFPKGSVSHLWVALGGARKNLPNGIRFTFRGYVTEYERKDGSREFGLIGFKVLT